MRKILILSLFCIFLLPCASVQAQSADSISKAAAETLRSLRARESAQLIDTIPAAERLPDALSVRERADALNSLISWRHQEIADSAWVDACGIYRLLGDHTDFKQRFGSDEQRQIQGEYGPRCSVTHRRRTNAPLFLPRSIRRASQREIEVEGILLGNSGNSHREVYRITGRRTKFGLVLPYVTELRVYDVAVE